MTIEGITAELDEYEYSLFEVPSESDLQWFKKHDRGLDDCERKAQLYEIAERLNMGTLNECDPIEKDLAEEPTNIHAWRNKVLFHCLKDEKDEAEQAVIKLKELMKDPVACADYAYWLANRTCTKKAFESSCGIFRSIKKLEGLEAEQMSSFTIFLHLKTLACYLGTEIAQDKEKDWWI
jgi:hypothetical protein